MLRPACERLTSSWKALLSLLQLHAGAGVCAERLPAVGMSATSQAVIPVNYLLIADFFPPARWVEGIEEFQVMVTVQIKLRGVLLR